MAYRCLYAIAASAWLFAPTLVTQSPASFDVDKVSPATVSLCEQWLAYFDDPLERQDSASQKIDAARKELLAQSDADLCLLDVIDNHGIVNGAGNASAYWSALKALGELDTDRTLNIVAGRLHSDDLFDRAEAVQVLSGFAKRAKCVPILVDILEHDNSPIVKSAAIQSLKGHRDSNIETVLIRAVEKNRGGVSIAATSALADMDSDVGVPAVVNLLLDTRDEQLLPVLFGSLRGFHKKAIVEALLFKWESFEYRPGKQKTLADRNASLVMGDSFEAADCVFAPKPGDHFRDWQTWWTKAEPILTEELKIRNQLQDSDRNYADSEYGHSTNDLELQISVDQSTFRVGDPIRLDLKFTNKSDMPYRVVLPKPPSGWVPTMAYGIRLVRDEEILLNIEPSEHYIGSYSGPPPFETLGPKRDFRSSVCLQYFLRRNAKQTLKDGHYKLDVTYNSAKYAGIHAKNTELIGSWQGKPITFEIKGQERTDPKEILQLIAEKTELPYLAEDLKSPIFARRERAMRAIFPYGDLRLSKDILNLLPPHYLQYFDR
jgi:HEAT repeats